MTKKGEVKTFCEEQNAHVRAATTACSLSLSLADAKFLDSFLTSSPSHGEPSAWGPLVPARPWEMPAWGGRFAPWPGPSCCKCTERSALAPRGLQARICPREFTSGSFCKTTCRAPANRRCPKPHVGDAAGPQRRKRVSPRGGTCSEMLVVRAGLPELSVRLDPTQLISSRARTDSDSTSCTSPLRLSVETL